MTLTMPTVEFFFDLSGTGSSGSESLVTEGGDSIVTEGGDTLGVAGSASGFFTVEDPGLGVVEGPGVVAGDLATDVSRYVLDVSITRGKSRQLDQVQAGTAQVTLRNDDRRFDPLNLSSPYVGNILPGKKVQITLGGQWLFAGKIDDWNFGYDVNGLSVATVTCVDAIGAVGAIAMSAWTTTAGQTSGQRIASVLNRDDVAFPASRSIDAGTATLQNDAIADGTNVLQYLQLVNDTELGHLFASKSNVLTFQGRNRNANQTATVFADTGTGIRFGRIEVVYGTELLFNTSIVSRVGGSTETFADTDSVSAYGTRTISKTDLLFNTDQQSSDMGLFLVTIYGEPELRIGSLTTNIARLTSDQRMALLTLELGDVISVTFTPDGLGAAITRECIVEGTQHDIRREDWVVSLALGDVVARSVFQVQDPVYGVVEGPGLVAF